MRYFFTIALLCLAATLPPAPPRPKLPVVLQSPKGAEQARSLTKVAAPLAVVLPLFVTNVLTWDGIYTNSIGFSVEWKPELTSAWSVLSRQTNMFGYQHVTTNAHGFYRVGAFYP